MTSAEELGGRSLRPSNDFVDHFLPYRPFSLQTEFARYNNQAKSFSRNSFDIDKKTNRQKHQKSLKIHTESINSFGNKDEINIERIHIRENNKIQEWCSQGSAFSWLGETYPSTILPSSNHQPNFNYY